MFPLENTLMYALEIRLKGSNQRKGEYLAMFMVDLTLNTMKHEIKILPVCCNLCICLPRLRASTHRITLVRCDRGIITLVECFQAHSISASITLSTARG
jgi:hypothetical protein